MLPRHTSTKKKLPISNNKFCLYLFEKTESHVGYNVKYIHFQGAKRQTFHLFQNLYR